MKTTLLLLGAVALGASVLGAAPNPAHAEVLVSGLGHTLCATVYNNRLQLNRCDGGDAQNWFTSAYGAQHYHGLCLDSGTGPGGSQLVVAACNFGHSQNWALTTSGALKNESGWCADINGGSAAQGTRIQSWTCNNAIHQHWATGRFTPAAAVVKGVAASNLSSLAAGQIVSLKTSTAAVMPLTSFTSSGVMVINTNASNIVAQGGGNIVAQGGGNIVAQGGGNIVAQGGGNVILLTGGSIVAQGGGN